MVVGQKIALGRMHKHQTVTVLVSETTLAVELADGDTRVIRRTTTQPVRSIKGQRPRTGGALDAANVRREFKAACRAAKIGGHWTPRELRHTFVSLFQLGSICGGNRPARGPRQRQDHRGGLPARAAACSYHWSGGDGQALPKLTNPRLSILGTVQGL